MRKWIHRILKGASLTGALFVFQACYGTPPWPDYPVDPESENMAAVALEPDYAELPEALVPEDGPETGEEGSAAEEAE